MYKIKNKFKAFSLIEVVVSLAIFSFIISIVIGTSISLVRAQTRVQAQMFLSQSAQTTIENMSRNLRYGYSYSGSSEEDYKRNGNNLILNTDQRSAEVIKQCVRDFSGAQICTNENGVVVLASTSDISINIKDSPFVLFEKQDGNPTSYVDQNAYCVEDSKLYKISSFQIQSNGGLNFERRCKDGENMLPEGVKLDFISFDILGQNSLNPKNPTVRIKMKLSSELGGSLQIQTTVTQRLIQIL